jgi:DNA modification methylase
MAVIEQKITDDYALYNGDCIEVMQDLPDESIHFSIYSPPFGGLYHYSSNDRDLSNCKDYDDFFNHYEYVVKEKTRITMAGRLTAVHCTDIPSSNTGKDYLTDFPGDIIRLHERAGWNFVARHTIWKEPLWVRNRTMCKNLAHMQVCTDAAYSGVASADYLLVFRKRGVNPIPIKHPTGFLRYAGECPLPSDVLKYKGWKGDQKENKFSHQIWQRYASSVWDDIRMNRILPFQKNQDDIKENPRLEKYVEKHVHPLQLDVIERAVIMRTNPGETVFTPFMGVGSEVYIPVELNRRGVGVELKPSYYRQAVMNLKSLHHIKEEQLDLADMVS